MQLIPFSGPHGISRSCTDFQNTGRPKPTSQFWGVLPSMAPIIQLIQRGDTAAGQADRRARPHAVRRGYYIPCQLLLLLLRAWLSFGLVINEQRFAVLFGACFISCDSSGVARTPENRQSLDRSRDNAATAAVNNSSFMRTRRRRRHHHHLHHHLLFLA